MWPWRKREEQRALTRWPWDEGPSGSAQFPAINQERALCLVPVIGAVRLLADSIASLTPILYETGANGVPKRLPTPELFEHPSLHGTLFDWLHRAVVSMGLQGDAIGNITATNFDGFPTMVEWLNPEHVSVMDAQLVGEGSYMNPVWLWYGRRLDSRGIVHIPWFSLPYKVRGLSPLGAFALTANVGLGARAYAAAWFNNGGVPPGTFRNSEQTVTKEDADMLTQRVTARLRDRKPLVFGKDWEYTPIAIKPNEAQFVETLRLTATDIAVIYGVPPEKIGGETNQGLTYSTVEHNSLDYLTFSLRPWLVRFEYALTRLFPLGQFVKFDVTELIRTDAKSRAEIDSASLGGQPWRTQDEVRATYDLGPMPKQPESSVESSNLPGNNGNSPENNGDSGPNNNGSNVTDSRRYLRDRIPERIGYGYP